MKGEDIVKRVVIAMLVLILLALDWAALHDILKGEADVSLEYGMVLVSVLVFAALVLSKLRQRSHRTRHA